MKYRVLFGHKGRKVNKYFNKEKTAIKKFLIEKKKMML